MGTLLTEGAAKQFDIRGSTTAAERARNNVIELEGQTQTAARRHDEGRSSLNSKCVTAPASKGGRKPNVYMSCSNMRQ